MENYQATSIFSTQTGNHRTKLDAPAGFDKSYRLPNLVNSVVSKIEEYALESLQEVGIALANDEKL